MTIYAEIAGSDILPSLPEYVKYSDYAALQAALKESLDGLDAMYDAAVGIRPDKKPVSSTRIAELRKLLDE